MNLLLLAVLLPADPLPDVALLVAALPRAGVEVVVGGLSRGEAGGGRSRGGEVRRRGDGGGGRRLGGSSSSLRLGRTWARLLVR